jgi:ABC-type branched-subunit amino acid transport system substrate-binding protein
MTRRFRGLPLLVAAVAVVALAAAACGSSSSNSSSSTSSSTPSSSSGGQTATPLKLGVLLPHTGTLAFLEPPMGKAVDLALKDINAAGGVNGKPVSQVAADEGTDPNISSQGASTLLSDNVSAIIGAAASSDTLAIINKVTSAKVVECSPSNTGAALTTYPDHGYYFRTAPPDSLQSKALANLIVSQGHSNVALVGQATEYGKGFIDGLDKALTSSGATVAAKISYDPTATTFTAEVSKIKASNPDAVVIIGYQETGTIIKGMIQDGIGPKQVPIYVADGAQSADLWKSVDPHNPAVLVGVGGTAPSAAPSNGVKSFPKEFAAFAPGVDTIYSAQAYDCAVVIALAADEAKSNAPTDFVSHMNDVTKGGTKCTSYKQCLQLIQSGTDIDYDGASGPLDFSSVGEPSVGTYDVWKFDKKGGIQTVKQTVVTPTS